MRASPQDFQVVEIPAFEPSGEGEHCMLRVQKTGLNTAYTAEVLAKHAGLAAASVSWAGMKDRDAVTEQWFSVHIGNKTEPDWQQLNSKAIQVLEVKRHRRKLKRGVLKGNRFTITLREVKGDLNDLQARMDFINQHGVPNYFGAQRFGRHGGNLEKAVAMFSHNKRRIKRHLRGIYLSAARALLFNAVLEQRVKAGSWNQLLAGEVCMLEYSHSVFLTKDEPDLQQRLLDFDIHPTGPLWGDGELMCQSVCRELEQSAVDTYPEFTEGLKKAGMKQARRALRVKPENLEMDVQDDGVAFRFELPAGAYATSVMRELVSTRS